MASNFCELEDISISNNIANIIINLKQRSNKIYLHKTVVED